MFVVDPAVVLRGVDGPAGVLDKGFIAKLARDAEQFGVAGDGTENDHVHVLAVHDVAHLQTLFKLHPLFVLLNGRVGLVAIHFLLSEGPHGPGV